MDFGMPTLIELPDLQQSAALCKRLGLKFIEINMSFPQYQQDALDIEELIRIKNTYGIYYTVHLDESLDPCNVNRDIARVYLESALKAVELAKILAIPTLNMHLLRGIYVTLPDRRTYIYGENMPLYLETLKFFRDRLTEAVGDSGIKICVENTDGFDLPFLSAAVELLLESPAFALTFDVGHDHAIGKRDLPFIMDRKTRLCHMHLHDAVGGNVHLALGDGEIDKDFFLSLAKEQGCRVVLETKTVEALKRSAAWANHWLNRSCSPDELWDLYDREGNPTGRTHRRGALLGEGEYHRVIHCWLKNSRGEYLLTKRDACKSFAGMWESPGGSVLAGETSLEAAVREIGEEAGLTLDRSRSSLAFTYSRDHFICDVWLFHQDFSLDSLVFQQGETCGACYADAAQVRRLVDRGEMVPYEYLDRILEIE